MTSNVSDSPHEKEFDYVVTGVIWFIHVLALLSIPYFSWVGFAVALLFLFGTKYGITIGFHRLLTHSGFKTYDWIRYSFAIAGTLAWQASVLRWVSNHRKHHQYADQPGKDPHTPRDGKYFAHMGWLSDKHSDAETRAEIWKYAPDLAEEWFLWVLHDYYMAINMTVVALIAAAGALYGYVVVGGWEHAGFYAVSFFSLAFCARVVAVWHVTWCVNSVTHLWGYTNYKTRDDSKNNPVIGVAAGGEGWHNNHHAHPTLAVHGHKWWELDVSYRVICLLRLCRLAWDVNDSIPPAEATGS